MFIETDARLSAELDVYNTDQIEFNALLDLDDRTDDQQNRYEALVFSQRVQSGVIINLLNVSLGKGV